MLANLEATCAGYFSQGYPSANSPAVLTSSTISHQFCEFDDIRIIAESGDTRSPNPMISEKNYQLVLSEAVVF